jgi:hypothetical protein
MKIGKIRFSVLKRVITRTGVDDEIPYLIRYNLLSTPWFGIKLHKILISDEACEHDHPWSFVSFILKGGYVEQRNGVKILYGPGSILYRPANATHRLEIFQPAYTCCLANEES